MKRALGYGLLGLAAYALFMLLLFPAATFLDLAARQLPGLGARAVHGSAVRGTAQDLRLGDVFVGSVSWQWRPLALLTGHLAYRVRIDEPQMSLQGVASMGLSGPIEIEDLSGHLALARMLSSLGRPALPLNGRLELQLSELRLGRDGRLRAVQGALRLREARSLWDRPLDLGDFSAVLSTGEQGIVGTVKDDGGPLELDGTLTIAGDGSYRFVGEAAVRDNNNQELSQALGMFASPRADGRWQIDIEGTLDA